MVFVIKILHLLVVLIDQCGQNGESMSFFHHKDTSIILSGGVVFLYHPCISIEIIESLRNLACSIDDDDGGEFRWILTPYPNVVKNIHVLTWQKNYMNDFFDAPSIINFISANYRNAPEDIGYDGLYDSLFIGKCENYGCIDSTAINFDSTAIVDNYSCEYFHLILNI